MALNEARIDGEGLIISADYHDESVQPWGGAPCFRYIVRVSATEGDWMSYAYGSQADYNNGDHSHAEEMAWMVVSDLLSAYDDPEEFFSLANQEPDLTTLEGVRGVLEVIDYAEKVGQRLEQLRDRLAAFEDGEDSTVVEP